MKIWLGLLACLLSPAVWAASAAPPVLTIRYALVSGDKDPHLPYMQALLLLACSEAGRSCELSAARDMNQGRATEQLQRKNGSVDLFWGMTSRERERKLLAIRLPLYKGLIGWRVALVDARRPDRLRGVAALPQLAALRAGQGQDWPDTEILRAAGLPVVTSVDYPNLFPMLRSGRYDYFPRSVIEVSQELKDPRSAGLTLDRYLLLHYPAAFYFFVSPSRPDLALVLRQGLERAIRDGGFEQTFQRFNGEHVRALKLSQRRIIELPNPLLPEATPLARRELWFRP